MGYNWAAMNLQEILARLEALKPELKRRYKVREIGVYLEEIFGCPVDVVPRKALCPELRAVVLKQVVNAPLAYLRDSALPGEHGRNPGQLLGGAGWKAR